MENFGNSAFEGGAAGILGVLSDFWRAQGVSCMADPHVIRVMAVDDHPLMMAGISGEINAQSDMHVVAEASDGDEALVLFRKHQPDVTLMDIRMPKVNGIVAVSAIRAEFPQARIIVLTTAAGDVQAVRAFKAGAVRYLFKKRLRTDAVDTS